MSTSESSLECNIPSSNTCICHMSTTTLGITEMMEQTENKRNWCWMKLSHSFSWVETHLRDNTYGHNTGWSVRIKCIFLNNYPNHCTKKTPSAISLQKLKKEERQFKNTGIKRFTDILGLNLTHLLKNIIDKIIAIVKTTSTLEQN